MVTFVLFDTSEKVKSYFFIVLSGLFDYSMPSLIFAKKFKKLYHLCTYMLKVINFFGIHCDEHIHIVCSYQLLKINSNS